MTLAVVQERHSDIYADHSVRLQVEHWQRKLKYPVFH